MALTEYGANAILDLYLESNKWLALFNGDPEGAGTELSGNGYARVAVTASTWDAAASSSKDNGVEIAFPEASGSWDEASYVAVYDAATAGNRWQSFALDTPVTITSGQVARFSAAAIAVSAS